MQTEATTELLNQVEPQHLFQTLVLELFGQHKCIKMTTWQLNHQTRRQKILHGIEVPILWGRLSNVAK
jgi:hypothetical protein